MTEHEIPREDIIYQTAIKVLRGGFLLSAAMLLVGAVWSIVDRHPLSTEVLPFQDIPGSPCRWQPIRRSSISAFSP